jgi:hypothetical protein
VVDLGDRSDRIRVDDHHDGITALVLGANKKGLRHDLDVCVSRLRKVILDLLANWLILGLSVASLITLSLALVAGPGFWGVEFWANDGPVKTNATPSASEASPQTDEACILASHSGGFGSLIRRTPYDG